MRLHKWSWSSSEGKLFGMASSKYFNSAAIRKPSDVTLGVSSTREKPLCYVFRTVPGRFCLFGSPSGQFAHYRELVKPKDTERYWGIKPAVKAKVVSSTAQH